MMSQRNVGVVAAIVIALGLVYVLVGRKSEPSVTADAPRSAGPIARATASSVPFDGKCDAKVTKEELVRSLELGTKFLIAHQRQAGNFDYQYDWKAKTYAKEDNDVRQAGALWGLALLQEYAGPPAPPPELRPALEKGLAFFDTTAVEPAAGVRYPIYAYAPGEGEKDPKAGGLGTPALVTLTVIDYVRGLPPDAKAEREKWTAKAKAYTSFLVQTREKNGLWYGKYRYDGGAGTSNHSPYSDGEALLALISAMKYLGFDDLEPIIKKSAEVGHRVNVEEALAKDDDSDETKGYYQWSSMAYYELATSKLGKDAPYGDWLMQLADWILDVHKVLDRPRNTGYAFEGIVSAYAWAKQVGDPRAPKFECAIHRGLSNLMSWQVGHPRAKDLGPTDDPKALGGVQNHKTEAPLRIDVTQHQMHATAMAIHHLFPVAR